MDKTELKNPAPIEFDAVIETEENSPVDSAWISFPFDLKETFGKGNLVPVKAIFDHKVHYQGSLATMGMPKACLILRKDVRAELGKAPGDKVHVKIELDTSERKVEVPADVKSELKSTGVWEIFEKLAYSHQKEYINWIIEAKKEETRISRIAKMSEMLQAGVKTPRN